MAVGPSEDGKLPIPVYRIKCPICGWVGAVVAGWQYFDRAPTGEWKCLRGIEGHRFTLLSWEEEEVPECQMSREP